MKPGPEPFARFLAEHRGAVLAYLRGMVAPADAEDLLQETFLAALRAWDGRRESSGRGWVVRIAHNKAVDHHRSRARRAVPVAEPPERGREDPDPFAGGELRAAVASLPEGQRAAIALRYFADLPYREVAATLGCSPEAARRRVADGLAGLRIELEEPT